MAGVTLAEIERFFVDEAALLDEWRLEEWLTLFAEDGRYLVPSLDQPHSDHRTALFLVADDRRNPRLARAPVVGWSDLGREPALAHALACHQFPHPR
jgi:3-phenylpropionate/cinnamic acid dioxygenase small subunit